MPFGLTNVKNYVFLELEDGRKILSKGKLVEVPIVIADLIVEMDLMVTSPLHDVDLILCVNWL